MFCCMYCVTWMSPRLIGNAFSTRVVINTVRAVLIKIRR